MKSAIERESDGRWKGEGEWSASGMRRGGGRDAGGRDCNIACYRLLAFATHKAFCCTIRASASYTHTHKHVCVYVSCVCVEERKKEEKNTTDLEEAPACSYNRNSDFARALFINSAAVNVAFAGSDS